MVKFKLTVTAEYEVPDERLMETYGTTDLAECARIDADNPAMELLALTDGPTSHTVEPVPATEETRDE